MAAIGTKPSSYTSPFANLLGNEVTCTIGSDSKTYKGNVSVFDSGLKAVLMSSNDNKGSKQVHLINLQNVDRYEITKTCQQDTRYVFHQIDYNKVKQRFEKAVRERKNELMKIGEGVSPFGQWLFDKLSEVYTSDTRWDGKTIVVMNGDVRIEPPYQSDNCVGNSKEAIERLKLMVNKKHQEYSSMEHQQQQQQETV